MASHITLVSMLVTVSTSATFVYMWSLHYLALPLSLVLSKLAGETGDDSIPPTNNKKKKKDMPCRYYGGPEGPCSSLTSTFPIIKLEFSHYQLPIWIFLIINLELSLF